jgi:hypothetical protein
MLEGYATLRTRCERRGCERFLAPPGMTILVEASR